MTIHPERIAAAMAFRPGARVRYVGKPQPHHQPSMAAYVASLTGKTAKVKRPVKSRGVVTIVWDETGDWFDANPASLETA